MTRRKINDESFSIEYLECCNLDSTKKSWRYPRKEDEQITETSQIIPCNVLDSVESDDENDIENVLNDSDTEYVCATKDAEDYINQESSVIQEQVLEAVVHPLRDLDEQTDFVIDRGTSSNATMEMSYCKVTDVHVPTPKDLGHVTEPTMNRSKFSNSSFFPVRRRPGTSKSVTEATVTVLLKEAETRGTSHTARTQVEEEMIPKTQVTPTVKRKSTSIPRIEGQTEDIPAKAKRTGAVTKSAAEKAKTTVGRRNRTELVSSGKEELQWKSGASGMYEPTRMYISW